MDSINGLKVNESKCNFLPFARGSLTLDTSYSIDNNILDRVGSTRDLGVMVDFSMSFDDQNSAVVKKSLRILGFIKNVSSDFRSASNTLAYI